MKKKIVLNVLNIKNWMGGVYYAKNIINLFMHSDELISQYEVHLLIPEELYSVFEKYEQNIVIVRMKTYNNYVNSINFIRYMLKNKIDYWYVLSISILDKLMAGRAIFWIADFQHIHLPQFFSKIEIFFRNANARYVANRKNVLVLSSEDARNDFQICCKDYKCACHVVHFSSDIETEISQIAEHDEREVLEKYSLLEQRYIYIPNQFWQHKNHIVVLEMIKQLIKERDNTVKFVFTGQMSDYRNPDYTRRIQGFFDDENIKESVINLGFLKRDEQLIIMKNASFLIQPSLFEGWGTVLEDAKVLDKRVILSDLDVHKEQMYEKCVLFKRNDAFDLLDKVKSFLCDNVEDDIEVGIRRFHEDSRKYAQELEKILL